MKSKPEPPEHLSERAKEEWGRVVSQADEPKYLDDRLLAAYCQSWGRWKEAEETLNKTGLLVRGSNGQPTRSPMVAIANEHMKLASEYWKELKFRSRGAFTG